MDLCLTVILAYFAEEFFHLACGLVHIDGLARLAAHRSPTVDNFARQENGLTGAPAKLLIANLKIKLTNNDVIPLILVVVQVARPAAPAGELENTHRAICVLCR